jgi:hypothetical protein
MLEMKTDKFFSFLTSQFERFPINACVLAEFRRKYYGKTPMKILEICHTAVKNIFLQ